METITIRPSQVPSYLNDSDFYKSLDIDSDEEFSIAQAHWKRDTKIDSDADLRLMLSTMQFWGINSFPTSVFDYLLSQANDYDPEWLREFEEAFPVLITAKEVRQTTQGRQASLAAKSDSVQFFAYVIERSGHISSHALSEAAAHGRIENLTLAHSILSKSRENPLSQIYCIQAAENGHFDCVKFLISHGCKTGKQTCLVAARNGHLDCLKLAHESGFPWDCTAVTAALKGGHYDCVVYAHQHGCHWPKNGVVTAAEHEHLDCLNYALEVVGERSPQVAVAACSKGNLAFLQRAAECGCKLPVSAYIEAAKGGHLHCLQCLHKRRCHIDHRAFEAALSGKHWECLRFLLINERAYAHCSVDQALAQDSVDGLKLIHECGVPLPDDVTIRAMGHNSVACLQYLHKHSLLHWDESASYAAVNNGSVPVLQLALSLGCPLSATSATTAARAGHPHMLAFLHQLGCAWDASTCTAAMIACSVECLRYLHEHGCPWTEHTLVEAARQCVRNTLGAEDCLQYAVEQGCPRSIEVARTLAKASSTEHLQYAHEHGCPWDKSVSTIAQRKKWMLAYCMENGCPMTIKSMKIYNKYKATLEASRARWEEHEIYGSGSGSGSESEDDGDLVVED